jgi:hypothetical protein
VQSDAHGSGEAGIVSSSETGKGVRRFGKRLDDNKPRTANQEEREKIVWMVDMSEQPCPHTRWYADEKTDNNGMVTEHCKGCGKTRTSYGSWDALYSNGYLKPKLPAQKVFPRLGHDSIEDIAMEVKYGEVNTMTKVADGVKQVDPLSLKPVVTVPLHPPKNPLAEIFAPVTTAAANETRIKELKKRGRPLGSVKAIKPTIKKLKKYYKKKHCPCPEMVRLRDSLKIVNILKKAVMAVVKEVKNGSFAN